MKPQAPEIRIPSEPLKIGWPVNSRMAEDLKPVADLLEFDRKTNGILESRFVKEAEFYPLRSRTITQFIKNKILALGILGDDVALDAALGSPNFSEITMMELEAASGRRGYKQAAYDAEINLALSDITGVNGYVSRNSKMYPFRKAFPLRALPKVSLELLRRKEDSEEAIKAVLTNKKKGRIITSYPRATQIVLFPNDKRLAGETRKTRRPE